MANKKVIFDPLFNFIYIREKDGFLSFDFSRANTYNIREGIKDTKMFKFVRYDVETKTVENKWKLKKPLDTKSGRLVITELSQWLVNNKLHKKYFLVGMDQMSQDVIKYALVPESYTKVIALPIDWSMYDTTPHGINLYKHQDEAINFAVGLQCSIIAHEMGLGKTFAGLTILKTWKQNAMLVGNLGLIIIPAFLRLNWAHEANLLGFSVCFYKGEIRKKDIKRLNLNVKPAHEADLVLMSYAGFVSLEKDTKKEAQYIRENVGAIVVDEVQYIKNAKSKRTMAFIDFAKTNLSYGVRIVMMSGTPMMTRPADLYNAIRIAKSDYMTYWDFVFRYNGAEHEWVETKRGPRQVVKLGGATNQKELYDSLQPIMHRRTKKQCLDLPDKTREYVYLSEIDFTPPEAHSTLAFIARMKPALAFAKVKKTVEYAQASKGPVIIFTENRKPQAEIGRLLQDVPSGAYVPTIEYINGDVSQGRRDEIKGEFQNGDYDYLICVREAVKAGLTLHKAQTVIFNDLPWGPGDLLQAEDRVHRIGLDHNVSIKFMVLATEEFEVWLATVVEEKYKGARQIIDNDYSDTLTTESMKEGAEKMVAKHYKKYINKGNK